MRLLEITDAIERLLADETVMDADGVLTPEGEKLLDALNASLEERCLDIGAYIKSERCEAAAISELADGLMARAQRHERRADSLERYLAAHLTPGMRLEDARCELTWRKSSAVEVDESKLPAEWFRTKTERVPMKKELAPALKAGRKIEGATLVERMKLSVR